MVIRAQRISEDLILSAVLAKNQFIVFQKAIKPDQLVISDKKKLTFQSFLSSLGKLKD